MIVWLEGMMWANCRQKIVYAGCSAPAFLGQSLRGTQPNFPPFSRSYYRGQALLFGEGSNTMLNVGSYVYRGFPFSTKPLREFTSSNIKSYRTYDRSRPFSSFSGDVVQSKPGNAKGEILHQPDERRVPMARSMWKGPFVDAFLLRMKTRKESIANKKIWSRRSVILPEFVNCSVRIYTGKTFVRRKITEGMVGHKFGEFALTRKRKLLRKNAEVSKKKGKR